MLSRSIGSLVRGRITPAQMLMACLLGAMLGFIPGLSRAPGAAAALILLLLVLNAPLGLALLVLSGSKLLSLLLVPLSFAVGRVLLDGPTQPLFRAAINAPVLGLFGFEHYAVTGGLLLGAAFGLGAWLLISRGVRSMRLRLAAAETDGSKLVALGSSWWAKPLLFVFVGKGHGKLGWDQLAELKGGRPIRTAGVIVALLLVGALFALHSVLTGPLLASALRSGLAQANGATVDVGSASLDLTEGRLSITGLALADPEALDHDLFRAGQLTADVSGLDLLRRRVRLEHVVISDASNGAPRESPGSLVGWRISAPPPPPPAGPAPERTLADYVKDYELWRDRLAQARQWLQRLAPADAADEAAHGETLSERLQREADETGYANVVARHLVEGAPTLLVSELQIDGLTSAALTGEVLDVHALNLSTQPSLVDGAPSVTVTARSGNLALDLGLGGLARRGGAAGATAGSTAGSAGGSTGTAGASAGSAGDDRVRFKLLGWPVDRIADQLSVGGEPPISGGTLDVELDGRWAGAVGRLDLPLSVTLHDTTMRLGGRDAKVSHFTLPIGLRGPLDDLAISIDDEHLVEALKAAGAAELSRRVDEEKAKLEQKATDKAGETLDKALDKGLDGLLGGKKKKKGG